MLDAVIDRLTKAEAMLHVMSLQSVCDALDEHEYGALVRIVSDLVGEAKTAASSDAAIEH